MSNWKGKWHKPKNTEFQKSELRSKSIWCCHLSRISRHISYLSLNPNRSFPDITPSFESWNESLLHFYKSNKQQTYHCCICSPLSSRVIPCYTPVMHKEKKNRLKKVTISLPANCRTSRLFYCSRPHPFEKGTSSVSFVSLDLVSQWGLPCKS